MRFFDDLTLYSVVCQAVGIIGIIASVISFQCKRHRPLILFRTINEFFFAIQYFMLGAYTGMAMNILGCVRNTVFSKMVEKGKNTYVMRIIFSVVFLIFTVITWGGRKSILSGMAKVLSTFAYGSSNTGFVRIMILITSMCWFIYNFCVGSYAGCVCELLTLFSIISGIVRIDIPKLKNKRRA